MCKCRLISMRFKQELKNVHIGRTSNLEILLWLQEKCAEERVMEKMEGEKEDDQILHNIHENLSALKFVMADDKSKYIRSLFEIQFRFLG